MPNATITNKGQVDLMSLFGIVKPWVKGVSLKDMDEAIRRSATRK